MKISSARLSYRRPTVADAPAIFARYSSDPEVTKYLGWARHRSVADAEMFVKFSDNEWATKPSGPLLIERSDMVAPVGATGALIGSTGLMWDGPATASAGYVLACDAWGQGFATETLGAMVSLAETLGVTRLSAQCHPEHESSQAVLRKAGFSLNARFVSASFPNLSGVPQDSLLFVRPPAVDLENVLDRTEEDIETCAQMMATTEPWITLRRTADALRPIVSDSEKELHVVRDRRGIAGFVILDLRGLLNGYVQTLCVREDRRGSGLGAALLTAAELRVLDQSANVFICVSSFNPRAQRFYAKMGYEQIGVLRDLVVTGHDEWLLRKTVRSFR